MSADPRTLTRFSVTPDGEGGYVLTLEDAAGAAVRFVAAEDQLDVLADLIDDALGTGSDRG